MLKSFLLGVGGASLASMTLMACYGMPPCDPESMSADAGEDPYDRCYDDYSEDGGEDGGEVLEGDAGVDGGI